MAQAVKKDLVSLIERYYNDPLGWAWDVCGVECVPDQAALLQGLVDHGHVSARSGHGTGKSYGMALGIWWFLSTRYMAKVPCTAPTAHQLKDVLWARLGEIRLTMSPLFADLFDFQTESIVQKQYPEQWHALARTARKEKPEALQGFHGEHLLFVVDEAGGVPDEIYEVAQGALTSENNFAILAGNPTRNTGFFFDSHHRDRRSWHCLHFNSENSSLVSQEYVKRMGDRYGRHSNVYRVRVLGDFPKQEEDQLIGLDLIENAVNRKVEVDDSAPVAWAIDPARYGDDETALAKMKGDEVFEVTGTRGRSTMAVVGWIVDQINHAYPWHRPSVILVDVIGLGAGVFDRLEELGYNVVAVNVSTPLEANDDYGNVRALIYGRLRDDLQLGRISLPDDPDLIAQLSSVKYTFDSKGRMMLWPKEKMKKEGMSSPDRADAVAMLKYMGPMEYLADSYSHTIQREQYAEVDEASILD